MPRYKPVHRDPMMLPVVLTEQIQPGTFEFALDILVDHELDLSALDARFRTVRLRRDPECALCGEDASIRDLSRHRSPAPAVCAA